MDDFKLSYQAEETTQTKITIGELVDNIKQREDRIQHHYGDDSI